MRLRRIAWIAGDLLQEMRRRPGILASAIPTSVILYPFLMGMTDGGLNKGTSLFGGDAGVRLLLTTQAIGPALYGFSMLLDLLHGRRTRKEIEPLLASPATRGEIVAGLAAGAAAPGLLFLPPAFAAAEAGRVLIEGPGRLPLVSDLALFVLASAAATVWLACFAIDAALRSSGVGELSLRTAPAFLVLLVVDGVSMALRLAGAPWGIVLLLFVVLAAGGGALALAARRLDPETILLSRS